MKVFYFMLIALTMAFTTSCEKSDNAPVEPEIECDDHLQLSVRLNGRWEAVVLSDETVVGDIEFVDYSDPASGSGRVYDPNWVLVQGHSDRYDSLTYYAIGATLSIIGYYPIELSGGDTRQTSRLDGELTYHTARCNTMELSGILLTRKE